MTMFPFSTNRSSLPPRRGRDPHHPVVSHGRKPRMHLAVIFLVISCWVSLSAATSLDDPPQPTETATLLVDTRVPVFIDGHWQIMSEDEHRQLRRRVAASNSGSEGSTTTIEINISTVTAATAAPTSTTAAASELPAPFDGALSANFSSDGTCPEFINNFLGNSTFKECYPVSLLIQSSQTFFEAEKTLVGITQVLDAACKADIDFCTDFLGKLADELIADGNCATDYEMQNALVMQAYTGMKVYNTVYKATCLTDPDDSAYCFANAVTNLTTASNSYLYQMPFNMTLPTNAAPACNSCTNETMGIFQAATSDRNAGITYTYQGAAKQINSICGDGFVNETLAAVTPQTAAASVHPAPSSLLLLSFIFMAISHWLL
ncbi:Uu.00g082170.m01.CDS01 [Anthostomella pinea]|uniref:Uu.00g082170.m01.CDS01 n=1 Tax=Anthostomella pinea TaxID=933095 RepID=A0AAI8VM97_9PEZI|nr:Uu.00g082170.m01.CDS01 [Anthostomella pinea]